MRDGIGGSLCRLVPARLGGMRCMPPQSDHSDEKAQTTASSASDRDALVCCFLGVCVCVFFLCLYAG